MDITEILTGVQYFYKTLIPKALYSHMWKKEDVNQAFQWVKFCKEVHRKSSTEISEKIDMLLHLNHKLLKDVYKTPLCFQDLQYCNVLLSQAFFENPFIDNSIVEELHKEQLEESNSKDTIQIEAVDTLCFNLIESLKFISISNSDRSFYQEIKSELFLDYLKNSLQDLTSENQETHLSSVFELFCKNEDNKATFFNALLYPADCNEVLEIQEFGVNWMLLKLYNEEKCDLSLYLLKQSPVKLRILAINFEAFFAYYIQTISKHVDSLKEEHECDNQTSEIRPISSCKLSYNQVISHFECLLSLDDEIGKITREHIISFIKLNHVWKKIACQLQIENNICH